MCFNILVEEGYVLVLLCLVCYCMLMLIKIHTDMTFIYCLFYAFSPASFSPPLQYDEMFKYYDQMRAANIRPDYVTFTVLLKVCPCFA